MVFLNGRTDKVIKLFIRFLLAEKSSPKKLAVYLLKQPKLTVDKLLVKE